MLRYARSQVFLGIILAVTAVSAQTPQSDGRSRTASISGQVTVGGAPAVNALVMVAEVDPQQSRTSWPGSSYHERSSRAFIKVRTNAEGRYRVTGLTEGAYICRALSGAYTLPKNASQFESLKSITLDEGESRDNVDLALVRGGVITGRVTDAEGRPLMRAHLRLQSVDENGRANDEDHHLTPSTDDRGIYRIYGLPEGRYLLSAGGQEVYGAVNRKPVLTFYPDVTDQKQAKIIEVKEGAEVTGIDIRLGAMKSIYEATGRVIDAETGQPLARASVVCREAPNDENNGSRPGRGFQTDGEGRFRVVGLSSGRYELSLWSEAGPGGKDHYGESLFFDVSGSDVKGLEVKAIRGSTLDGVVVIEGVTDPSARTVLSKATVGAFSSGARLDSGRSDARVDGEGGFHLTGLAPGMVSFQLWSGKENAISIKRIERNGLELRRAFEIGRGEQVTGIRIVVARANGTIHGQVEIVGGKLPANWELNIEATPIRTTVDDESRPVFHSNSSNWARADEHGRFVIEGMVPGEYELTLSPMVRENRTSSHSAEEIDEISQRVTVNSGAATPVKLTLDLSRKRQEDR